MIKGLNWSVKFVIQTFRKLGVKLPVLKLNLRINIFKNFRAYSFFTIVNNFVCMGMYSLHIKNVHCASLSSTSIHHFVLICDILSYLMKHDIFN